VKRKVSLSTIQDRLGIYHGVMLQGLNTLSVPVVVQMIRLQRHKTADKKKLAEEGRFYKETI
jgi:hypothetical protein